ncbi:MAG TPA: hypothetical protein VGJ64_03955, partial [Gemmatimonadaceae bacterium]
MSPKALRASSIPQSQHARLATQVGRETTSRKSTSPMAAFAPYIKSLEQLTLSLVRQGRTQEIDGRLLATLDGQPQRELRALVPASL